MTPCSTAILAAKVKLPILHLKHRDFHSRSCMKVLRENCGVINDCESAKRNERGKEKISVLLRSGREAKVRVFAICAIEQMKVLRMNKCQ